MPLQNEAIDTLRQKFSLSTRAAARLVQEFGPQTQPADWADTARVLRIPGFGLKSLAEVNAALEGAGLLDTPKPKKLVNKSRLSFLEARKRIQATVRSMGGEIRWTAPVDDVLKKRARRRERTVQRWREKYALETMNRIAATTALEGRCMTPEEGKVFDKLLKQVRLTTKRTARTSSSAVAG